MSKLSDHQIAAMIQGIEAAHGPDHSTALRYRAELADRLGCTPAEALEKILGGNAKTARSGGEPDVSASVCNNYLSKNRQLGGFREGNMDQKKDALAIAGEQLAADQQASIEVAKWVGRQQAFGLISNKCSAAQAEILKRLKDGAAHKAFGLSRDEFCDQQLGLTRQTADRIISNYEEFGAAYFAMSNVMRISPATYRLLGPAVDANTNELIAGDEKIPITKANSERIIDVVNAIRQQADQAKQQAYDAKSELKKAREERDNAKKAVDKARQDLHEMQRKDERMFERAEGDHRQMLLAQSRFDFVMLQCSNIGGKELSVPDQARLIGLLEYMFRSITQVAGAIREKLGLGWNAPEPGDAMIAEDMTPNARNLLSEYVEANKPTKAN